MIANLLPYQIMQPWVDAAFKKRGIDPENFWRSAGLPAFRWPDPNGTRFPNGAPPAAPPVLEGTPDHPGPAVAPGSPCSYTPPPELVAAAGQSDALRGCRSGARSVRTERPVPGACPTCCRRRRTRVVCHRRRASRSPGDPGLRRRHCRAHRCRCRRRRHRAPAPKACNQRVRFRRRRRSRPGCHPDRRRHRAPARSCRPHSSRPTGREGSSR